MCAAGLLLRISNHSLQKLNCGLLAGVTELNEDEDPDDVTSDEGLSFIHVEARGALRLLTCVIVAGVMPLQALGVIDVGATHVGDNEMLVHALANTSQEAIESGYAVKRSGDFINEYPRTDSTGERTDGGCDDPNHFMGAFPTLYCYGKGCPETRRSVDVPYNIHIRAAIQHHDKRFSSHLQFIFQAFGVLQKRQICSAACLQVKKKDFIRNQEAFRALTPQDLLTASGEEARKVPFSNPVVKSLRSQLTALRTKVMGTDESRVKIRGQIKGMCVMKGPPSLWITINPSDTGDPIAQVFAGENIDMDAFVNTSGPNSEERSRTIAADPYAAAKFFHYVIAVVLEELFGIVAYSKHTPVKRTDGIFGKMASYIGTVEAQGRGTLHLHIVAWLCGSLTSSQMRDALQTERFRSKIQDYIAANIRADLQGANEATFLKMPRVSGLTYSRPCDPRLPGYKELAKDVEIKLAKAVQHHKCSIQSCLLVKKNRMRCKRRAPFDLSTRDYVDKDGRWGPKRSYGFINNWNPAIMQCIRANHDIKLITNGAETRDISFYISQYVAKRQTKSSNASALLAKKLAFHKARERYNSDISRLNKRLLQRCANTLSREQEFSAPEVISYLMGWGDRFISHYFVNIRVYWSGVMGLIKKKFPGVHTKRFDCQTNYLFGLRMQFLFRQGPELGDHDCAGKSTSEDEDEQVSVRAYLVSF